MNGDIIAAQLFEGELYIKASDHHRAVKAAVEAEREACANEISTEINDEIEDEAYCILVTLLARIRARGQE